MGVKGKSCIKYRERTDLTFDPFIFLFQLKKCALCTFSLNKEDFDCKNAQCYKLQNLCPSLCIELQKIENSFLHMYFIYSLSILFVFIT